MNFFSSLVSLFLVRKHILLCLMMLVMVVVMVVSKSW